MDGLPHQWMACQAAVRGAPNPGPTLTLSDTGARDPEEDSDATASVIADLLGQCGEQVPLLLLGARTAPRPAHPPFPRTPLLTGSLRGVGA